MKKKSKTYGAIMFPGYDEYVIKRPSTIAYCKAAGSYCIIFFKDGNYKCQVVNMKYVEDRLDPYFFFRLHNSFIVNMRFVASYRKYKRTAIVMLKNGEEINVANSLMKDFIVKIKLFPAITRIIEGKV